MNSINGVCFLSNNIHYLVIQFMSKLKKIIIQAVTSNKSEIITYNLEGEEAEKLETTMGAFEDVLATHFNIDPMVNSLDIVDAVALD